MAAQPVRALARLLAAGAVLLPLAQALSASPEAADQTYRALRYDDDPQPSGDLWDPLKRIPAGEAWLNLGGELRERAESYASPNFGLKAPRASAYGLHRLLLHADLHATDTVRAFVQLGQMERAGNRGTASATDVNRLDLMQAFVDIKPASPFGDQPTLRAGREELLFGFQRLIAVREGPNVRRGFDGFRLSDRWGGAGIDLIAVRPVTNGAGVFDDRANQAQVLWGAYATLRLGDGVGLDLYELNYRNATARFRGTTGAEQRQTWGARLFGEAEGFDWNAEVALQQGTFRNRAIRAQMAAAIVGYTFADLPWRPRIGLEANAASGDDGRSSTIGTFNAMFPRLPYFAQTSLLVPANVTDVRPVLGFSPAPGVSATLGWDTLWRASATDGLYGSGMVQYAGTSKATGMRIGTELSADVRWRIDRHLSVGAIAAELLAGPAITQAGGKSVVFLAAFATYRF
jgi:hypothetical protein